MQNQTFYSGDGFSVVKAVLLSLAISFLLAVVFAVILRATGWGDAVIYTVNQVLKGVSLSLGTLVFIRGEKGFLKGVITGVFFSALSYLAFSALGGDFSLSWMIAVELTVALSVGGLSGALAVNLKP